jgi:hypothetical protein
LGPGPRIFATVAAMQMIFRNLQTHRVLAAAPLLAVCLLLAGCGGSSNGSGAHQAAGAKTSSTTTKTSTTTSATSSSASSPPSSGSSLAAGLVKSMAASQPQLKNVTPHCPGGPIKRYPVKCRFTATETASGKHVKLAGTITVSGQSGSSYQFGLNYAPTH